MSTSAISATTANPVHAHHHHRSATAGSSSSSSDLLSSASSTSDSTSTAATSASGHQREHGEHVCQPGVNEVCYRAAVHPAERPVGTALRCRHDGGIGIDGR